MNLGPMLLWAAFVAPEAPAPTPGPAPPGRVHVVVGAQQDPPPSRGVRGVQVSGTVVVGSGASIAPGPTRAIANRSPAQLTLDAGFRHPDVPWLEISPAMMLEMERGVAFGLAFRVRAFVPLRRVRPYALVGVPAFLAPTTLLGATAGLGLAVPVHRHFAVAAEFGPTVFFAGDDLIEGNTLVKIDGALGLRVMF